MKIHHYYKVMVPFRKKELKATSPVRDLQVKFQLRKKKQLSHLLTEELDRSDRLLKRNSAS